MSTRIVATGDLHCGSSFALSTGTESLPRDIGRPIRQGILKLWQKCAKDWHKPDVMILNGDLVEGKNKKEGGADLWTQDVETQALQVCELVDMWEPKEIIVVAGSQYHVALADTGASAEQFIAKQLGATFYPHQEHLADREKARCGGHAYLSYGGVTMHVQHHCGVSSVFHYRATPLAKQMLFVKLRDDIHEFQTDIVLRSHTHYFCNVRYSHSSGYNLPCWKGLDNWMARRGAVEIGPVIGFVGFTIGKGGYRDDIRHWSLEDVQPPPVIELGRSSCRKDVEDRRAERREGGKHEPANC